MLVQCEGLSTFGSWGRHPPRTFTMWRLINIGQLWETPVTCLFRVWSSLILVNWGRHPPPTCPKCEGSPTVVNWGGASTTYLSKMWRLAKVSQLRWASTTRICPECEGSSTEEGIHYLPVQGVGVCQSSSLEGGGVGSIHHLQLMQTPECLMQMVVRQRD